MESSLQKRLSINPQQELQKLLGMFQTGEMPLFDAGMTRHFEIAKEKSDAFVNHPTVLGISFGGTNTKIVLASMQNGELLVHHVQAAANPEQVTHLYDYFDQVLLGDPVFAAYLKETPKPVVGISVPTRVIGRIPVHETKVPTIDGLLARNPEQMTDEYDLGKSFAQYLQTRGCNPAILFYQGDGIVAHHGAVALCEMGPQDRSTLMVCGTGMATGDEEAYIQAGIARMLDVGDEALFPAAATEEYQYHYATAGKGLFNLMERAIRIRAGEPGSLLGQYDLAPFFANNHHSRTVGQLWESTLPGQPVQPMAEAVRQAVLPQAFAELQTLATWIMERCIQSMANITLATVAKMGRASGGNGHIIFFEGSIATAPNNNKLLRHWVAKLAAEESIYAPFGMQAPLPPNMDARLRAVHAAGDVTPEQLAQIDLTAIGAATMAMCEDLI